MRKLISRAFQTSQSFSAHRFCKLVACFVEKLGAKTLKGLESSGNKLSHAISPILLAYFLWLLKARKQKVVRQKKLNKANKVSFNDDPGTNAEETFVR